MDVKQFSRLEIEFTSKNSEYTFPYICRRKIRDRETLYQGKLVR